MSRLLGLMVSSTILVGAQCPVDQEINAADDAVSQAFARGHAASWSQLTADDWLRINPNGTVLTRPQQIAVFKKGVPQGRSIEESRSRQGGACRVEADRLPRMTLLEPYQGRLAPGETTCLGLALRAGEFVRIVGEAETGGVRVRILEPQRETPILVNWWIGESVVSRFLTFEAPVAGVHIVELHVPEEAAQFLQPTEDVRFSVQVDEQLSPQTQAARKQDVRSDPRTTWLRQHAVAIRTVSPEDDDFSDLAFLQEVLSGVRIVLLGEGDHGLATLMANMQLEPTRSTVSATMSP
jgi:hypothetical protein